MTEKKHVVITGAGSGLGASLARKYNKMGYYVTLIGRSGDKLKDVAAEFNKNDYSLYTLNISNATSVIGVFNSILRDAGPIDILVNNAGVGFFEKTESLRPDYIDQMIDINLKGTIFCTQQVIPEMKARNQGTIINIISTAGLEGKETESVYAASKFGVKGFTKSLEKELVNTDIRVSAIYMGGMGTPFWDGTPNENRVDDLMDPDAIADVIIENTRDKDQMIISEIVIRNH